MSFEMKTVGVKERATKGHQEVAFPADMRRCKDILRIPASKYSPRDCVWRPKSERPTRATSHEYDAAYRWCVQAWRTFCAERIGDVLRSRKWRRFLAAQRRLFALPRPYDVANGVQTGGAA